MKQTGIPQTTSSNKKEAHNDEAFFLKSIAMGGPGLNALIQLSDLKLFFVNKQFEYSLGYTNDDIAHESIYFTDIIEPYELDRFLYQLKVAKESTDARFRYVIYALKSKKGEITPYYLYAAPAYNENDDTQTDGDIIHITLHPDLSKWDIPFTSFITRELFFEHFNSEDFGTFEWIIDVDKVFWSEGLYRIYEVDNSGKEINSLYDRMFIHPNDIARVEEETKKAIASGNDLNIDYKIITAKQNIKIIHCLARTIKNHEGKPVKFAGSIRDITSQRSIEEDLKNKVRELYQSNKELEEFAYVASHDMQEPLRKITIFSDRLSEKYKDVLTGDGATYLSRMIASAENMRSLIDDLLEFSKISKTQQPFEPVSLDRVLQQVRTDLELVIEETGTVINSQALPTIEAIPSQMKQLFANIISNAIKFHKPGIPPVITIESEVLPTAEKANYNLALNTTFYKIQVIDNGVGFEDEYAVRIFQVFQRLHGKSEYPGSGIGLAICKKIVECHKGTIYAENIPEKGARFVFMLPQHQQPSKEKNI